MVITRKPGRCENSGSLNTSQPHRNITQSCAMPMSARNIHFPASRPVMPMLVDSSRSSVPDSTSSSSAPPAPPTAENSRNITPMPAA